MSWKGSFVALITPFTPSNGIDFLALENLLHWHLDKNTHGIILLGTTGENSTITDKERGEIISYAMQIIQKKIPLLIGVGTNCTARSIEYTMEAKDLGADGVLAVTPYYNKPSPEGCIAHFEKIAEVGVPVMLYHIPQRTNIVLELTTIQKLAQHPHITSIKEASKDVNFIEKIVQTTDLDVFCGEDTLTLDAMEKGAKGSVGVIANIIPDAWSKMLEYASEEKYTSAREILDLYTPLLEALSLEVNPQCIKYALSHIGKCRNLFRLPILAPNLAHQKVIEEALEYAGLYHKKNGEAVL